MSVLVFVGWVFSSWVSVSFQDFLCNPIGMASERKGKSFSFLDFLCDPIGMAVREKRETTAGATEWG